MPTPLSESRRGQSTASLRAFTLIELMVVVVIITLMSAIAIPGVNRRIENYRAKATAEEVAGIYRNARLQAMGRGAAVLVRYSVTTVAGVTQAQFEIREAIQGNTGSAAGCQALPETSCTNPGDRWGSDDRSRQVDLNVLDAEEYLFALQLLTPAALGTPVTSRTALDVCYTPLGRPYADLSTAGTLELMTTTPRLDMSRADTVGIARSVLITTVGPARVVADE